MKDPKLSVLDLLTDNWDNTNTSLSYDPDIHTGWHNPESSNPEVTVSSARESPTAGGTGFSAIDPSGAGGVQEMDGIIAADCWSDREVSSVNPKTVIFELTEEVKRIIKANTFNATDLRYVVWRGRREIPPANEPDPTFHYATRIWYQYEERP